MITGVSDGLVCTSERDGDEEAIDEVVTRAFGNADEANLVRMLRERQPGFDRSLSLCAWDGDEMVGYIALIRLEMRLVGARIAAAAVAPVAVVPPRQRQGVAGRMLECAHRRAREQGVEVAFLNGHPSFYPRHGYRACFGFSKATYDSDAMPDPSVQLEAWPVRSDDVPWLLACDEREWGDVDFSWPRTDALHEWAIEGVNAVVWRTADGRRAAYTLTRAGQRRPGAVLEVVLGDDPELVRQVLFRQRPTSSSNHPRGWLAREVLQAPWGTCQARASDAAMALELVDGALAEYSGAVEAGRRLPGVCNWPIPFIMC